MVESYASHGAYARVDDVLIYIPLRLMDSPTPRSARSVLAAGEAVAAVWQAGTDSFEPKTDFTNIYKFIRDRRGRRNTS